MANTTFSGPIRSGTVREGSAANVGVVNVVQAFDSGDLTGRVVGNIDSTAFRLPAGAQIIDIFVDQTVAATAGTTTVQVGSTSGGAELMPAVATTAGGRFRGTATAATQAAWFTTGLTDTTVFVRCAVGTATLTAGRFYLTIEYIQR